MILNETSYFGAGCRETIAVEAARRGFKKAFFVTDRDLIRFKVADKVIEVFEKKPALCVNRLFLCNFFNFQITLSPKS